LKLHLGLELLAGAVVAGFEVGVGSVVEGVDSSEVDVPPKRGRVM